jgi:hypothetical protein
MFVAQLAPPPSSKIALLPTDRRIRSALAGFGKQFFERISVQISVAKVPAYRLHVSKSERRVSSFWQGTMTSDFSGFDFVAFTKLPPKLLEH